MEKTKFEWMNKLESNVLIGLSLREEIEDYITELKFQFEKQQYEINRLKEENTEMVEMIDLHQAAINQFFDKKRNQNKQQ